MTQRFASVQDVARFLDVSPTTVARLIDRGELRAVRIGRARRIPTVDAVEFVNRQLADHG
jgi:excisionase family DNA binding protein